MVNFLVIKLHRYILSCIAVALSWNLYICYGNIVVENPLVYRRKFFQLIWRKYVLRAGFTI